MALSGYKKGEQVQHRTLSGKIIRGFEVACDTPCNAIMLSVTCKNAEQPYTGMANVELLMSTVAPDPGFRPKVKADVMPSQAVARDAHLTAWFRSHGWPVPAMTPTTEKKAKAFPKPVRVKTDIYGPGTGRKAIFSRIEARSTSVSQYMVVPSDVLMATERVQGPANDTLSIWDSVTKNYKYTSTFWLKVEWLGAIMFFHEDCLEEI